MSNRILRVQVRDRSLDPAQAELWVVAEAERVTPTTELRGRLMGPRCVYAATVEVAYPLRPLARPPESVTGPAARVVIPEPSLWDPEGPFVYDGTVELWEGGVRCDDARLRRSLRRILLGPGGLRVNGRPLLLRGRAATECDDNEAAALRRAGVNLLVAAPGAATALWELADIRGFFVLGRLRDPDEASLALAERRAEHPSCFGWLLGPPFERWAGEPIRRLRASGARVGVALGEAPAGALPEGIAFAACPAAAASGAPGLPLLLVGAGPDGPGMIGRVQ